MIDVSSFPISGGILAAGISWVALSAALGGEVADRMIESSGWNVVCEPRLQSIYSDQVPKPPSRSEIDCDDLPNLFGQDMGDLCAQSGGDLVLKLLTLDPAAAAKEQARELEEQRILRKMKHAQSRCDCAAHVVAADRTWWIYAGTLRLKGGETDLKGALLSKLNAPICAAMEG